MFEKDIEGILGQKADAVTSQIRRQPELWKEAVGLYGQVADDLNQLLDDGREANDGEALPVIITANADAMDVAVGAASYLAVAGDDRCSFSAVDAATLAEGPEEALKGSDAALVVLLSRGGAVDGLQSSADAVARVTTWSRKVAFTCMAADEVSGETFHNEEGVAITLKGSGEGQALGGFTSLLALMNLAFGEGERDERLQWMDRARTMAEMVTMDETAIAQSVPSGIARMVFMAQGLAFRGVVREAVAEGHGLIGDKLELSVGDLQSALGDDTMTGNTLAVAFLSSDPDERSQALATLDELSEKDGGPRAYAVQQDMVPRFMDGGFTFTGAPALPDAYLALPYALVAQVLTLMVAATRK